MKVVCSCSFKWSQEISTLEPCCFNFSLKRPVAEKDCWKHCWTESASGLLNRFILLILQSSSSLFSSNTGAPLVQAYTDTEYFASFSVLENKKMTNIWNKCKMKGPDVQTHLNEQWHWFDLEGLSAIPLHTVPVENTSLRCSRSWHHGWIARTSWRFRCCQWPSKLLICLEHSHFFKGYVDILMKEQQHQVVTYHIAASYTLPPSAELACELRWPVYQNLGCVAFQRQLPLKDAPKPCLSSY